jgi:hypothetical protein
MAIRVVRHAVDHGKPPQKVDPARVAAAGNDFRSQRSNVFQYRVTASKEFPSIVI